MRRTGILLLCTTFLCACAAASPAPPDFALTWAKPNVAFDTFAADVDACNVSAEAAGRAVEPRRGDPANDLSPPILAWRWLAHGADVDAAMAGAYQACFAPRGYALVYVAAADAQAFRAIALTPSGADAAEPPAPARAAQLRLLHRLATAAPLRRARLTTRQQPRPLVSYVAPP